MNLCRFEKPSRYINREVNSVYREGYVKIALAFPDIYDIGMSHLGLKILYKVINDLPYASAERVFSPWLDAEAEMKASGAPLLSLENKRRLSDFDIIGFSLQYELSYTTVLNMLSMSEVPVRSAQRNRRHPLIIAGGPCTVNPAPMSAFIDAFLIGDGEDAIKEIADVCCLWKKEGDGKRESLLRGISKIDGMYVPSVHGSGTGIGNPLTCQIRRRRVESLNDAPYPESPVVPYTSVVHDRINMEISRGCSMGCRFCQAGMIYRPQRERSPERIMQIAESALRNTGHEEISLTSLSAGDYTSLLSIAKELNRRFSGRTVSVSLPSLRVAAVRQDVLKEIKLVRKSGFTMAPEAGTERLRAMINKDFSEEDYERALHALFAEGWESIKLYFMIGLPGERDEDILAIPDMAFKAVSTAKKYTKRRVNVNVGISPFVPKPHTPFQWLGQEDMRNVNIKIGHLRKMISQRKMNFKGHSTEMSLLEAVFSRGDERLSGLIERAWSLGCRLDAWTESFDFRKWLAAAEDTGIDIHGYAQRHLERDDKLPWDGINTEVKKDFLWREHEKAISGEITIDCNRKCYGCGAGCKTAGQWLNNSEDFKNNGTEGKYSGAARSGKEHFMPARIRCRFSKTGVMRYLSHRELMTAFIRAFRRADMPLLYSQGFHPLPRISFGPPLSVGISGLREYFDVYLDASRGSGFFTEERINNHLPEDLKISEAMLVPADEPSLDSFISRYEYEIICRDTACIDRFLEGKANFVRRRKADGTVTDIDLGRMIEDISVTDASRVRLIAVDNGNEKIRINELATAVFQSPAEELSITRCAVFGWQDGWVEPLHFRPPAEKYSFMQGEAHVQ